METDDRYMALALALAKKGLGNTSPNPMVGAVIVKHNRIIGKGYHAVAGGPHAEVDAIDHATEDTKGATIYVTLEPCNHTGRTPPCTKKIIEAGIAKVVIAMEDPNPHVKGGGIATLQAHGIAVACGPGEHQARRLNEAFITFIQHQRPFVTIKCAATLDGWIATRTFDSKWITGEASREYVHQVRHAVDAIMVGIGTVRADNPSLNTRLSVQPDRPTDDQDKKTTGKQPRGRDPVRIVIDPELTINTTARVLTVPSPAKTILLANHDADREKIKRLEKNGVTVVTDLYKNRSIDFIRLMGYLGKRQITSLLIEGGGDIIGSALRAGVVDKCLFFYAPKLLGGDDGVPICRGPGPEAINDCLNLRDITTRQFGDDVLIEGYVDKE